MRLLLKGNGRLPFANLVDKRSPAATVAATVTATVAATVAAATVDVAAAARHIGDRTGSLKHEPLFCSTVPVADRQFDQVIEKIEL